MEVVPQLLADTKGRLQVLKLFRCCAGGIRVVSRRDSYGPCSRSANGGCRTGRIARVYFEQVAVPAREAAFDFTDASDVGLATRASELEGEVVFGKLRVILLFLPCKPGPRAIGDGDGFAMIAVLIFTTIELYKSLSLKALDRHPKKKFRQTLTQSELTHVRSMYPRPGDGSLGGRNAEYR